MFGSSLSSLFCLSRHISKLRINNIFIGVVNFSKNYSIARSKSYYTILGLKPAATDDEIKQAYYSLSKKYHPDLNIGNKSAESKILEINAAFEVLGNKAEKEIYDNKMFPKIWEKNAFIYDLDEKPKKEAPNFIFRRVFKHLSYTESQHYKHTKGVKQRKRRHFVQRVVFNKSQSSKKFSTTHFKIK